MKLTAFLLAGALVAPLADFADAKSSSSSRSSGASSSRSSGLKAARSPAVGTSSLKRSQNTAARSNGASAGGSTSKNVTRRSLIAPAGGATPSPRLAQVIQSRESSGPGWLGTAFLVSLLSSPGLSHADRTWVQSRLSDLRSDEDASDEMLLPAAPAAGAFRYSDLSFAAGHEASLTVSARDAAVGQAMRCTLSGAGVEASAKSSLKLAWTPAHPGVDMLVCRAGTTIERRLVRVDVAGK